MEENSESFPTTTERGCKVVHLIVHSAGIHNFLSHSNWRRYPSRSTGIIEHFSVTKINVYKIYILKKWVFMKLIFHYKTWILILNEKYNIMQMTAFRSFANLDLFEIRTATLWYVLGGISATTWRMTVFLVVLHCQILRSGRPIDIAETGDFAAGKFLSE